MPENEAITLSPEAAAARSADMSRQAETQMKRRVLTESQDDPGALKVGAQMGRLSDGKIAPTDTFYQAFTTPKTPKPSKIAEEAAKTESSSTLTSATGQAYLNQIEQRAKDADASSADAARASADAAEKAYANSGQVLEDLKSPDAGTRLEAERVLAKQKEAEIRQKERQFDQQAAAQTQFEADKKEIKEEFDRSRVEVDEAEIERMATERAVQIKYGRAGTPYADAALEKTQTKFDRAKADLDRKEQKAYKEAWKQAMNGQISISEKLLMEADRTLDQRLRIEQLAGQEEDRIMQMKEYEDNRALAAQEKASSTLQNLVEAGFTMDDLPESYLEQMDESLNMPSGYSSKLFDLQETAIAAGKTEDQQERYKAELANVEKLTNILSKLPEGESVEINGVSYTGYKKGKIKSGWEEVDGESVFYEYNEDTEQLSVTPMGKSHPADDGWIQKTDDKGGKWWINSKTNQREPATPSQTMQTWEAVVPAGSTTTPWRDESDPYSGQCGATQNDVNDPAIGRIWGNSLSSKLATVKGGNPLTGEDWEIPVDELLEGDTVIQSIGTYGHVARVAQVAFDEKSGQQMYRLFESNFDPPGGETVTHDRWVFASEITAGARVPTRPEMQTGPDSPATINALNQPAPTGEPTFDGKTVEEMLATTAIPSDFQGQKDLLESLKGEDNFTNTEAYQRVRSQYDQEDDRLAFDRNFGHLLNPKDPVALKFKMSSISADASAMVTDLVSGDMALRDLKENTTKKDRAAIFNAARDAGWEPKGNSRFWSMPDKSIEQFTTVMDMEWMLGMLEETKKKVNTGPFASKKNAALALAGMASEDYLQLSALSENLRSVVQKDRSGLVLSVEEVRLLSKFLPTIGAQDATFDKNLKLLKEEYNKIMTAKAGVYGFNSYNDLRKAMGQPVDTKAEAPTVTEDAGAMIRVRLKSDKNNTGSIPEGEFDPNLYEKI